MLDREEKGSGVIFLRSLGLEVCRDLVEDVGVDVCDQGIVEFFLQAIMPAYYTDVDTIFNLYVMPWLFLDHLELSSLPHGSEQVLDLPDPLHDLLVHGDLLTVQVDVPILDSVHDPIHAAVTHDLRLRSSCQN